MKTKQTIKVDGQHLWKIMEVKDQNGKAHPIYGDDFASMAISDVLAKLSELEAKEASQRGHDA